MAKHDFNAKELLALHFPFPFKSIAEYLLWSLSLKRSHNKLIS